MSDTPTPRMNTPRTDEAEDRARYWYEKMRNAGDLPFDAAEFDLPRQLELELAEAKEQARLLRVQCNVGDVAFQHLHCASRGKPLPDWVNGGLPNLYTLLDQLAAHKAALEKCEKALHSMLPWMSITYEYHWNSPREIDRKRQYDQAIESHDEALAAIKQLKQQ